MSHDQEDELSRSQLYFTNDPVKPAQKGISEVDGDEQEPFILADPHPTKIDQYESCLNAVLMLNNYAFRIC